MSALEEQVAALLKQAAGEPPVQLDAAALVGRARPRRRWLPALAAAAVVLPVAVVVLLVRPGGHPSPEAGPAPTSTPTSSSAPPTGAPTRAEVLEQVRRTQRTAPVPPGFEEVDAKRSAGITLHDYWPGAAEVRVRRTFSGPGTVAVALRYLRQHPPAGLSYAGWFGDDTTRAVSFGNALTGPQVDYLAESVSGGVVLRMEVWQTVTTPRPDWSFMSDSVSQVAVTVTRSPEGNGVGAPAVRRIVSGAAAQRLADLVDQLNRPVSTGTRSCPMIPAGRTWTDRLVFTAPSGRWTVTQDLLGCGSLTITAPGHSRLLLDGSVDTAALRALGLPSPYPAR